MAKNKTINVQGTEINIIQKENQEFISLTDMVKGGVSNLRKLVKIYSVRFFVP